MLKDFFKRLAGVAGLPADQPFVGMGRKNQFDNASEEVPGSEALGVPAPVNPAKPRGELSSFDRAEQVINDKPELTGLQKFGRVAQTIGAGLGNDGGNQQRLRLLKNDFESQDQARVQKFKNTLSLAKDLDELETNKIKTDKLRREVQDEATYNKAAQDPNSDLTKIARGYATQAVRNAQSISAELKTKLIDQIEKSNADQIKKFAVLEQLGVSEKINLDTIKAANSINDEKRAANKDSREEKLAPYQIESEQALAGQRNAAAQNSRATAAQVAGLNKAEAQRDKKFAESLDKDFSPATQTMKADAESFKRMAELVSNGEFSPDDLAQIAETYNSSKGDLGLFADSIVKLNLSPGAQEFGAIISDLAPRQRPPGSGTTSDLDLRTFFKSLGAGLTDKNALLNRVGALQKRNETNYKNNVAKYNKYTKDGTLKGYNDFDDAAKPSSTGSSKYQVEEETVTPTAPKKSKYTVEEVEE